MQATTSSLPTSSAAARSTSSSTACHLLPDRLCWWRPAGPTEETTLKRVLAANSSWCRKGPASISGTGSTAPSKAELGRAPPFSSVVAASGHEILEEIKACPSRPSLLRQSSQRWAAVAAMRLGAGYLLCALALALEVP